jgi:rhodanese-related sulfurtransferase
MMNKSRLLGWIAAAAVALALPLAASANKIMTPEKLDGVKLVTAEQVQQLMSKGAPAFDVRVTTECTEKTIKGAVCHVYREKSAKVAEFNKAEDQFDMSKLPSDKGAPVIFFCNSGECWRSYKASVVARDAGYKQVHWFRGGMPEWTGKNLPTQ